MRLGRCSRIESRSKFSTSRRLKVTYVIWALERGGAERVVFDLARFADRNAFEPSMICLTRKGPLASELERAGLEVLTAEKRPGLDVTVLPRLVRMLRGIRPDILSTHLWTANFWGRLAGIICGVPVMVATEHGADHSRRIHHHLADYMLAFFTARIVAVSDAVTELVRKRLPGLAWKVLEIRNGIPAEEFERGDGARVREELGISAGGRVVAAVGRLVREKGQLHLVGAAPKVLERFPETKFLIVGEGPMRGQLEEEAGRLEVEQAFIFAGARDDVCDVLHAADVFALPSLHEGLPLSLLEAMAAGRPVVSTRIPGVQGVVSDGVEGRLVPPQDEKELAEAILEMLADPERAKGMGQRGKERVRREFAAERMVSETEGLYLRLVEERRR